MRWGVEPFGHGLGVGDVAVHAKGQGLDALQQVPRGDRRHRGAEVAQRHGAHLHGEAEIAEGLVEGEAVVGGVGLAEARELVVLAPVELARFDDGAAHGAAVAADVLGGRVDDDVGAPLERPAQVGRGQGVVDHQRDAGLTGDDGDGLEVEDDAARVGEALAEDELHLVGHRGAEIVGVRGVDEMARPAELLEAHPELGDRPAVEIARRDELVAGLHEGRRQQELGGVAGGRGDAAAPPLEGGDALLEHGDGGVGHARIDETEGLQVEQLGGPFGVVEDEGGGLENGRRARPGHRVGAGAGVDGQGLESVFVLGLLVAGVELQDL